MEMKDKLVKFNHKRPYYTMKKCAISFAIFGAIAISASIPLSISYLQKAPVAPHAEEKVDPEVSENITDEEKAEEDTSAEISELSLISY